MTDHPDAPLTPPETLEPPKPVQPVAREQADRMVPLDEATQALLDEKVTDFIDSVILAPVGTEEFESKVMAVHSLGNEAIRESASVSNRFLERPMNAVKEASDSKSRVSKTLLDLRKTVEDLDPARQGDMFAPKKLFGVIPLGKNVRDYFLKYQSAQGHLDKILEALYHGQDELRKDNATVEEEKVSLWETMKRLESYIYLAKKVDAALETRVTELERTEPEKARVVKEEMLFYVRQKVQDLQTQLAVSIQGYLALDLVRKNNLELIKGVDRASTTTVSALRTAVMVSQGLANQKLVLNQISALNTTTGNLIESTSSLLKKQSTDVHAQAAGSAVDVQQLQKAFQNVYAAMDAVTEYRVAALGAMKETVNVLSAEIDKSTTYLDRVRDEQVAEATKGLKVEALGDVTADRRVNAPSSRRSSPSTSNAKGDLEL